jgi:sRNA-binding carbon storage regulator CsrA
MLVLTRKSGEKVIITNPEGEVLIIIDTYIVGRNTCKLGISADKNKFNIYRSELLIDPPTTLT